MKLNLARPTLRRAETSSPKYILTFSGLSPAQIAGCHSLSSHISLHGSSNDSDHESKFNPDIYIWRSKPWLFEIY